jgi:hypothetical protein
MARIERTRCWWVPMRPVTPFMMMPTRWRCMAGDRSEVKRQSDPGTTGNDA